MSITSDNGTGPGPGLGWRPDAISPGELPDLDDVPSASTHSEHSDGSSARYYELPPRARELQDLISYKNMNAQIGEIFRACYRYGQVKHSPCERDINKILFYAEAELARLRAARMVKP